MKLFILLSTLLLSSLSIYSQTNEFAPVGAKWWYDDVYDINYEDTSFIKGYVLLEAVADTVVNGTNCRKIVYTNVTPAGDEIQSPQPLLVYENLGKVYCYSYDDSLFHTLYDFNGEDWYAYDFTYGTEDSVLMLVDSVTELEISGMMLTKIHIAPDFTTDFSFGEFIIQKMGSLHFFFLYSGADDTYPPSHLRCYEDNKIFYTSDASIPCDLLVPSNVESSSKPHLSFTFHDNKVVVSNPMNESALIQIVAIDGNTVVQRMITGSTEFDLNSLARSVYIISVRTSSLFYTRKIYLL